MSQARILVVEDESIIAAAISDDLVDLGYEVIDIVASAEAAISCADASCPDLILMDISLQGRLDGIEAAKQIQLRTDTPVVYLTSYTDEKTLQRSLDTNSFGYMLKPYKVRELRATIETALKKHNRQLVDRQALEVEQQNTQDQIRYLAITAHELTNPLAAIKLSIDLLDNAIALTSDKKNRYVDRINTAVDSMDELINNTMTMSQAKEGKLTFNPESLDVTKFCHDLIEEMELVSIDRHTLRLLTYGTAPAPCAQIDKRLLHPILKNLLHNAIKYSPDGGEIDLELTFATGQAIFVVRDRGIGIPTAYFDKLFQKFERAANVGKIKGTGLGLNIVKQLVDLHQGAISVDSEINRGTAFTVVLPC